MSEKNLFRQVNRFCSSYKGYLDYLCACAEFISDSSSRKVSRNGIFHNCSSVYPVPNKKSETYSSLVL